MQPRSQINGYRIEIGDVEAALRAADGVDEACVVPVGDGAKKRLIGFLKCKHAVDAGGGRRMGRVPDHQWTPKPDGKGYGLMKELQLSRDTKWVAAFLNLKSDTYGWVVQDDKWVMSVANLKSAAFLANGDPKQGIYMPPRTAHSQ